MAELWPDFNHKKSGNGMLAWAGPLKPKGQVYFVHIFWRPGYMQLPYVLIDSPKIEPRPGCDFIEIPHLIFNEESPEHSGLCLFDPDQNEWSGAKLIAETTVPWASEWLAYYELWHLTGDWLGPSVGYESIAEMMAADALQVREHLDDVY